MHLQVINSVHKQSMYCYSKQLIMYQFYITVFWDQCTKIQFLNVGYKDVVCVCKLLTFLVNKQHSRHVWCNPPLPPKKTLHHTNSHSHTFKTFHEASCSHAPLERLPSKEWSARVRFWPHYCLLLLVEGATKECCALTVDGFLTLAVSG